MKKNKKVIIGIGAAVIAVAVIVIVVLKVVSGNLDVVGKESITSFEKVLNTIPDKVKADEMNAGWSLEAPDGSVRFIWSEDYSKSPLHDVMLEFDAAPFVNAGLDVSKLPENYAAYEGMLMVGIKLGSDEMTYQGNPTPLAAYEQIVKKYRSSINYHTALDHYGVKLGGGNMFEWAKDMAVNTATDKDQDKDIVFVLNPEPLIAAGVNPEQVEGWAYAQVPVEENGKTADVYKFLKPFNLQ
ncbi:hypothetical protein [Anaerocolumna xylanovorans]|uniref:Uncharacterized protein n=1 Tax=Anaerocolumna xylanovorans DSM 12503 TaxID=1121345 RepID=A0A1M7YFF8_9FIRM|nr:hypothetical protein [Anaerocolumna xylanovorans]SHO51372.1 hypothetical protein SAMN02745217_03150 [Anaerocolumna xylanovorans DSM 12503]